MAEKRKKAAAWPEGAPFERGARVHWRGCLEPCIVERVHREGATWRVLAKWPDGASIESPSGTFKRAVAA